MRFRNRNLLSRCVSNVFDLRCALTCFLPKILALFQKPIDVEGSVEYAEDVDDVIRSGEIGDAVVSVEKDSYMAIFRVRVGMTDLGKGQ